MSADLHDIAAEWFARSRGADWSAAEAERMEAWLAADPRHRASYDDVAEAWAASREIAASPAVRGLRGEALAAFRRPKRRRMPAWLQLAAAVLAFVVLGAGVLTATRFTSPTPDVQVYRTDVGERATVTLADGSQATLNTASALAVEYTPTRRGLRLISGEAWFDVAKNPSRPFVVTAGAHTVTATGTSFDVRLGTDRLAVAVSEGRVVVAAADETPLTAVTAGQQAQVGGGRVTLSSGGPLAGDWRGGRLQFEAVTLAQAVAEMNRYRRTPIVLDDPGVGALRVSGVFEAGEDSGFLDALPLTHPVRVTPSAQAVHLAWRGAKKNPSGP
ncbi:FecR family protein [Phenylobacterium sp. VNQ135]|uniref:FecR family protein n=1 Tax=Phenylobacterium sp. VNQ135 TaxID=3400922 RepID=UPI003C0D667B